MLIRLKSEKYEGLFAAWESDDMGETFQFAYKNENGWKTFGVTPGPNTFEISDAGMEHLIGFVDEIGTLYKAKADGE